jgi:hypothetical protein
VPGVSNRSVAFQAGGKSVPGVSNSEERVVSSVVWPRRGLLFLPEARGLRPRKRGF